MKKNILMFFTIMIVYAVVDIVYQMAIGLRLIASLLDKAGVDVFSTTPLYPGTIILFFAMIAFALLKLVVQPAIEKRKVSDAIYGGIILGVCSYGTLAFVRLWAIENFPIAAFLEILLEGALFSPIAAGFTTWLALRKQANN